MELELFYINRDKKGNYYHPAVFDLDELNSKPIYGQLDRNLSGRKNLDEYFYDSHYFTDFRIENYVLYGTIHFLQTPKSRYLKYLIEKGDVVMRPKGCVTRINESKAIFHFAVLAIDAVGKDKDVLVKRIDYDDI